MAESYSKIFKPEGVAPPGGKYNHAVRVRGGEFLIIAGQIATDINGKLVGANDAGAQTKQVFANLDAILKSAGGSWDNVVELMYYIVGRKNVQPFMDARTAIFAEKYPKANYPTATLLVVEGLAREELLIEVSGVAILP